MAMMVAIPDLMAMAGPGAWPVFELDNILDVLCVADDV